MLWKSGVGASWWEWLGPKWFISVETLAAGMIVAASDGVQRAKEGILENPVLIEMGRKGLAGKS